MPDDRSTFLDEWHRVVAERDLPALAGLLNERVSLGAPPYWTKLEGRDLVHHLLGLVLTTIEDFTYRREWQIDGELALEFTGRVGDLELLGIDLISVDEQGQVQSIDVLMRPVSAIIALRDAIAPQMAAFLAGADRGAPASRRRSPGPQGAAPRTPRPW